MKKGEYKRIVVVINRIAEDRYVLEDIGENYYLHTNLTRKELMKRITRILPRVPKLK